MTGKQGWTLDSINKMKNAHKMHTLKSCGNTHAYCKVCMPTKRPAHRHADSYIKQALSAKTTGRFAGKNNPNWKGGIVKTSKVGWNDMRRQVWARDTVCKLCQLPPHPNRRLDVHHIIPRRDGGKDTLANLVGLHHSCHIKVEFCGAKLSM